MSFSTITESIKNLSDIINKIAPIEKVYLIGPIENSDVKNIDFNKNDLIFYIDGGLNFYRQYFTNPAEIPLEREIFIGDGDSVNSQGQQHLDKVAHTLLPTDKSYSDLEAALMAIEKSFANAEACSLQAINFLGGRQDHHFANILSFYKALSRKLNIKNIEVDNRMTIINTGSYCFRYHGSISLFTFDEAKVSITGQAKYLLENQTLSSFSSHGLSNVVDGDVEITTDKVLILFRNEV
ncbi:thiamine diphosphokinase [Bacteriovoracaceae bacterium]|nr:thiamine diphosphokinase [Bacteriovoracaceae bacterium]